MEIGVIVAGDNVVETDAACVQIMGANPWDVAHIRLASERGLGSIRGYDVVGESIEGVRTEFDVPVSTEMTRGIWNWFLRMVTRFANPMARLRGKDVIVLDGDIGRPIINLKLCSGCRLCSGACPVGALTFRDNEPVIDDDECIRCFCCAEVCSEGAISKETA